MVPIVVPTFYDAFPDWVGIIFSSGISSAAVAALLLNFFFNEVGRSRRTTEAMGMNTVGLRVLSPREAGALQDGDQFVDGRLLDAQGREIPFASSQEQYESVRERINAGELTSLEDIRRAVDN